MPEWIHNRAEHILAKNPSMPKSQAFAVATQQAHAVGKSPKGYGTSEGRHEAHLKFKTPKDDKKTANPGGLESPKMAGVQRYKRVVDAMTKAVDPVVSEEAFQAANTAGSKVIRRANKILGKADHYVGAHEFQGGPKLWPEGVTPSSPRVVTPLEAHTDARAWREAKDKGVLHDLAFRARKALGYTVKEKEGAVKLAEGFTIHYDGDLNRVKTESRIDEMQRIFAAHGAFGFGKAAGRVGDLVESIRPIPGPIKSIAKQHGFDPKWLRDSVNKAKEKTQWKQLLTGAFDKSGSMMSSAVMSGFSDELKEILHGTL